MSQQQPPADMPELDGRADLETILAAWHEATLRLEQTHEVLQGEVRRLTQELEVKNRELARKNRLADLGQMASHVAHEVRNNLVPVSLYLSLLRRRVGSDRGSLEIVDKISASFTALDATVNDLLQFTADREPQWQTFALDKLVDDIFASLAPQLDAQGIEAVNAVARHQLISADNHMLRRAILNLCLNALDAMPSGGSLSVRAALDPAAVEITVADSGPGLSEDVLLRAFEPFFSTKPSGTGLGLAIVARTAEVHGGECTAANGPRGGAEFTLRIPQPVAQEAAA